MFKDVPRISKNRLIRILTEIGMSKKEAIEIHEKIKQLRRDLKKFEENQIKNYQKDKIAIKNGLAYHQIESNA